jgi:hypothetical protein
MSNHIKINPPDSEYQEEFLEFDHRQGSRPSNQVDSAILQLVAADLIPSHSRIFFKLLIIQSVVGILTMLFCPQFDLSLTNRYELFHFFHRTFGHYGCMAVCGALFIGSGAVVASILMTREELKRLSRSSIIYYLAISGCAITSFLFISPEVYLDAATTWYLGATVGGISMMQLVSKIRHPNALKAYTSS